MPGPLLRVRGRLAEVLRHTRARRSPRRARARRCGAVRGLAARRLAPQVVRDAPRAVAAAPWRARLFGEPLLGQPAALPPARRAAASSSSRCLGAAARACAQLAARMLAPREQPERARAQELRAWAARGSGRARDGQLSRQPRRLRCSAAGDAAGDARPRRGSSSRSPRRCPGCSFRNSRALSLPWPMRLAVVGVPGAGLLDDVVRDAEVDDLALARDALAVEDVELGLRGTAARPCSSPP